MGFGDIIHRAGWVWIALNLAAIAFFTALYFIERAWIAVLSRRLQRSQRRAPVVCIGSR